ncbi:hypothetical protein M3906_000235 [Vibrio metschnikovii]|nr:hypothetical protein [Vibrio metschnikovii]
MNILFNAQGEQVPARPAWHSDREEITAKALNLLFEDEYCGFKEESDREPLKRSLLNHYHPHIDEYDLCKYFEDDGWDVDRDFLTELECVTSCMTTAIDEMEKEWFEKHHPVPPFEIGTELKVLSFKGKQNGVIDGIYEYSPATYTVIMNDRAEGDTSRRLIKFEDAVKVIQ